LPFGAADSMISTGNVESVLTGTRARIVCSRFNFSVLKGSPGNSFDECKELSVTWFVFTGSRAFGDRGSQRSYAIKCQLRSRKGLKGILGGLVMGSRLVFIDNPALRECHSG
jgi:hypothetical protein